MHLYLNSKHNSKSFFITVLSEYTRTRRCLENNQLTLLLCFFAWCSLFKVHTSKWSWAWVWVIFKRPQIARNLPLGTWCKEWRLEVVWCWNCAILSQLQSPPFPKRRTSSSKKHLTTLSILFITFLPLKPWTHNIRISSNPRELI